MADLDKLIEDIPDRYSEVESLGQGGMGVVLKARDRALDKIVAIKMLHSTVSDDQVARFQLEAKACGRLKHSNILDVLDFGVSENGSPYFVMDYLEGRDLAEFLDAEAPLDLEDCLPLLKQIARGLAYAHENGVIHRDIKPSNIVLLDDDLSEPYANGENRKLVKIIDFGLAKLSKDQNLTQTGVAMGSPLYMSPEQVNGVDVAEESDIYSFGCLAFKMLTGQEPFIGNTALDTMNKKVTEQAPKLKNSLEGQDFPVELEELVADCLATEPGDRVKSFGYIANRLAWLEEECFSAGDFDESVAVKGTLSANTGFKVNPILVVLSVCTGLVIAYCIYLLPHNNETNKPIELTKEEIKEQIKEQKLRRDLAKAHQNKTGYLKNVRIRQITKLNAGNDYDLDKIRGHSEIRELELQESKVTAKGLRRNLPGQKLIRMDFSNSKLNDEGLYEVGKITTLQKLSMSNCEDITDTGIGYLKKLKSLELIILDDTKVTDKGALVLSGMKSLNFIDIRATHITTKAIECFAKIPNLVALSIGDGKNKIDSLESLTKLKKLETLTLDSITADYEPLTRVKNLKSLGVKYLILPTNIGDVISKMKKIKKLVVRSPKRELSPEILKSLGTATNLKELHLNRIPITKENLPFYGYLRSLPKVYIGGTYGSESVVDADIKSVLPHCTIVKR